jgi:hypothetical protein
MGMSRLGFDNWELGHILYCLDSASQNSLDIICAHEIKYRMKCRVWYETGPFVFQSKLIHGRDMATRRKWCNWYTLWLSIGLGPQLWPQNSLDIGHRSSVRGDIILGA